MAGYIEVPDAQIKEPVYPGSTTPEQLNKQLNRGVSFQLLVILLLIVRTINLQI